jgi:hypothetical protein
VVVINFLNRRNAADVRVYELLDEKFKLFSGLFGASDEVLGSIEAGVDFERRIADIYQNCKDQRQIQAEFDKLQEDLSEQISVKMTSARQSILENFDEEVAAKLNGCYEATRISMDKFSRWLCSFFIMQGAERVEQIDQWRFAYKENEDVVNFNLQWKDAERRGDIFLRKDDTIVQNLLREALENPITPSLIRFDHTNAPNQISFLINNPNIKGTLSVDKLSYRGFDKEEHILVTVQTDNGIEIDDDMMDRIFELPARVIGDCSINTVQLEALKVPRVAEKQSEILDKNKRYFFDECAKLDARSEDLKIGLHGELDEIGKEIYTKKKKYYSNIDLQIPEAVEIRAEISKLEREFKKMRREIESREDEIDKENENLQNQIRARFNDTSRVENIMTIAFEIV